VDRVVQATVGRGVVVVVEDAIPSPELKPDYFN
jgi:hypothetical protein